MKFNKWISWRHIGSQLFSDLIGKDSFRGVSLTYSWLANQFGHMSIGFIHTMLMIHFCCCNYCDRIFHWICDDDNQREFAAAAIVSLFWLSFEAFNFLGPLLTKRRSHSNLLFIGGIEYHFLPRWWFIGFDTATDVCIFSLGAFLAAYVVHPGIPALTAISILMLIILWPCYYWFVNKMYHKSANYPMQFNLSQWDHKIDEKEKTSVNQFIESMVQHRNHGGDTKHLLIFGSKNSGKSSLAIGIASALSDRRFACRYLTANSLYSLFFGRDLAYPRDETIWNWKQSELLVIDEINPGRPIFKSLISPTRFLKFIDRFKRRIPRNNNRDVLKNKFVIWIIGNSKFNRQNVENWKSMVEKLGLNNDQILTIDLSPSSQKFSAFKAKYDSHTRN